MPRAGFSDVNWFVRAVRVVPVIAGAALVGGMIGGFAIYAIDSALTLGTGFAAAAGCARRRSGERRGGTAADHEAGPNCGRRNSGSVGRHVGAAARAAAAQRNVSGADFAPALDAEAARASLTVATANRNSGADRGRTPAAKSNGNPGACFNASHHPAALARRTFAGAPKSGECGECE
jgi:hypothetical protein